ncbi:hypothetical protein [Legionella saoudiensis]|uniref:hypothetical protein n=1 Tax=Legionella saoudiensis TaxID=1750561 RepID=UPI000730CCC3|nr:hypothetical protein [Legionella saoudiensis]
MEPEKVSDAVSSAEQANDLLIQMQAPVLYDIKKPTVFVPLLKRIPFLSQFVKNASEIGEQAMHVGRSFTEIPSIKAPSELGHGFHWGAAGLAALDFLLIPMIYLSSYIYGEKVPFTLNNNARWMYSGVLLGLTLTALLVPAAASPIGLILGGASLGLSTFLLGKAIYERYHLGKERKALVHEIAHAEEEMSQLQEQAKILQESLARATTPAQQQAICAQVDLLKKQYDEQKDKIIALKEREAVVNEKVKKLGFIHILDKGLGVGFASIAMVGLVVSLFFPAVGFPILAGVGIASTAYLAARIFGPLLRDAGGWIMDKIRNVFGQSEVEKTETNSLENTLTHTDADRKQVTNEAQEHESLEHTETHHAELNSTGAMLEHFLGTKEAVIASLSHEQTTSLTNDLLDADEDLQIDRDSHVKELANEAEDTEREGESKREEGSNHEDDSESESESNSEEEENRLTSF